MTTTTMNDYIKSFVIGSSFPVFLLFFLSVAKIQKNYTYENYSLIAPFYLGFMNVVSLYIARQWKLSLRQRFMVIGVISPLLVITFAFLTKAYTKTTGQWLAYATYLFAKHFFIFNIIVYHLEKVLENFDSEGQDVNKMVTLITNRGILAPNCEGWEKSDRELDDSSGINLFYRLKEKGKKTVPVKIFGEQIQLVTDIPFTRVILDNSPFIFGVGKLKYQMFKSFMNDNVGVSTGCPWVKRRELNEDVLNLFPPHRSLFHSYLAEILNENILPTNFTSFNHVSKQVAMKIVFNDDRIVEDIFTIFSEANSLQAFSNPNFQIHAKVKNAYLAYLIYNINNPNPGSLVAFARQFTDDEDELIQQIPHWIFPMVGLINTTFPRMLLLLVNQPPLFNQVLLAIHETGNDPEKIYHNQFLRNCVLETLRLNNPVVTTFRTLLQDFQFPDSTKLYKKGTQFLILNNPILRDATFFQTPNRFIPDRWNSISEDSYHAIMFNQGDQKCPGKELSIFVLQSFLVQYLMKVDKATIVAQKININNIPQMMNPCKIHFDVDP